MGILDGAIDGLDIGTSIFLPANINYLIASTLIVN